jgi:hypothetical protein
MKCVIHIGTEKTGTTLLQKWLYSNQVELHEQRVFLSDVLAKPNNRHIVSYFQKELDDWTRMHGIYSIEQKRKYYEGFEKNFADEVKDASEEHDYYLITSEHFHSRLKSKEEIEALYEYLKHLFESVTIVCYFREQAEMALSRYSTTLKGRSILTIEEFFCTVTPLEYYYNYKMIADNWSDVFGRENCIFRIYDKEHFIDRDLRVDFIDALGIGVDVKRMDLEINNANCSLSKIEGDLYKEVNDISP